VFDKLIFVLVCAVSFAIGGAITLYAVMWFGGV
jgi:hypothetical protein